MYVYVCMYVCMYVYVCICMYVCMYMYVCICMYVFIYIACILAFVLECVTEREKETKDTKAGGFVLLDDRKAAAVAGKTSKAPL